ncbi:hypothetical protein Agabi119p4_2701 [Agaricus bisporus var. burnettii]|uniref:Uncharacterized protein n=1 Tax=Agaricus bisporus var. burnettii TaxID=192524 RepID=A0A8H7F9R5_AGABI|nr:hypothetical protein Agabi119p4_2701 [Agaricus bisporus var. burnettii]
MIIDHCPSCRFTFRVSAWKRTRAIPNHGVSFVVQVSERSSCKLLSQVSAWKETRAVPINAFPFILQDFEH